MGLLSITSAVALCIVLIILGYPEMRTETNLENLWLDPNSQVKLNLDYENKFLNREDYGSDLQLATLRSKTLDGSVMNEEALDLWLDFSKNVMDITVEHKGQKFNTQDICSAAGNDYSVCLGFNVLDCFSEGKYIVPDSFYPIAKKALTPAQEMQSIFAADPWLVIGEIVDQCGGFATCLAGDPLARYTLTNYFMTSVQKIQTMCAADPRLCQTAVQAQCTKHAICLSQSPGAAEACRSQGDNLNVTDVSQGTCITLLTTTRMIQAARDSGNSSDADILGQRFVLELSTGTMADGTPVRDTVLAAPDGFWTQHCKLCTLRFAQGHKNFASTTQRANPWSPWAFKMLL